MSTHLKSFMPTFRVASAIAFDAEAEMAGNPKLTKQTQQVELEECERRARLFKLVEGLVGDQRRVVVMRFAEEKSIRDIANEMGRSEGAIKQLQFRALENLRARLASQ